MQVEKNQILQALEKHFQEAIALSLDLSDHPELPYEEYESSKKIAGILEESGFQVTYPYAGYDTAFCGYLDNGEGPSAALLVEYDALPGSVTAAAIIFTGLFLFLRPGTYGTERHIQRKTLCHRHSCRRGKRR